MHSLCDDVDLVVWKVVWLGPEIFDCFKDRLWDVVGWLDDQGSRSCLENVGRSLLEVASKAEMSSGDAEGRLRKL